VLFDVPRAPLPSADTPAPVRFLPKWDNVLLGFADRRRMLDDEIRKAIIGKNGDVAQTVLVDGRVAATWTSTKGRVEVEYLVPVSRTDKAAVAAEAARLQAWFGA
jgi:hypothetical protein